MSTPADGARSIGRVRTIVKESSIAWVTDFQPLERDVLVRLSNPWQAKPGELLDYELRRSAGEQSRWHGADVIFNREFSLADVLALDTGRGLSAAGLRFVLATIAREPQRLGEVFSQTTSLALKKQILEYQEFPLPAKLVEACLRHEGLRVSAKRRVQGGPLDADGLAALLADRGRPADEAALWKRVREEAPELLRAPLDLPAEGLVERIRGWRRATGEDLLLLHLPVDAAPAMALDLLQAGLFARQPADAELAAALQERFGGHEEAILEAALRDSKRRAAQPDPLDGLRENSAFGRVLERLVDDATVGAEALARLLGGASVEPRLALRLLLESGGGPDRPRLLAALPGLPATEAGDLPAERLLEWFDESSTLSEAADVRGLQRWLGGFAAVAERCEGWLAEADRRDSALAALAAAPAFGRGLVQRLLGLPMDAETRRALAAAISARNPERWNDRYLLSAEEREAWKDAGAPL